MFLICRVRPEQQERNKSPNPWPITSILVCCIFGYNHGCSMQTIGIGNKVQFFIEMKCNTEKTKNIYFLKPSSSFLRLLHTSYLSVLDFLKSVSHKIDFWTWFFVYFKLDSTACVVCKNQLPNRQKIKFKNQVQKSSSKLNFVK